MKMLKLSVGDYVTYTGPAGIVSVVKILHFNSNGTVLVKYLNKQGLAPLFLFSKRGKK